MTAPCAPEVNVLSYRGPRFAEEFSRLTPQIERALEYANGLHTVASLRSAIESGQMQLWYTGTSVIITKLTQFPGGKVLEGILAAGKLCEIQAMTPVIEWWAQFEGCTGAMFHGRHGWARTFMADVGYQPTHTIFFKRF